LAEKTEGSGPREVDICGTEKKNCQRVERARMVEHVLQDLDGLVNKSERGKAPARLVAVPDIQLKVVQKIGKAGRAVRLNDSSKEIISGVGREVVPLSWIPALIVVTFVVGQSLNISQFATKEVLWLAAGNILLNVLV
jgi:hypothetical protein